MSMEIMLKGGSYMTQFGRAINVVPQALKKLQINKLSYIGEECCLTQDC
jgi:hypothetical protein